MQSPKATDLSIYGPASPHRAKSKSHQGIDKSALFRLSCADDRSAHTCCTGIDIVPRHIEISRFLSEIAGVNAEFLIASAETFSRPEEFDVILHFGTLYHLPNPVLSLRTTFDNLRSGGYLALETQVYDHL
jgi:SAM-dependent methyltransferase